MFSVSLPLESLWNSKVGKRKSLMTPLSTISTIIPASSELRDKRSGC